MTVIFADTKQINALDENTSDALYYVEVVKVTGRTSLLDQGFADYRFIAKTREQVPQDGVAPIVENEYLLPIAVNNDSAAFFKNALNLPAWKLAEGVIVTENEARRFAWQWLSNQDGT